MKSRKKNHGNRGRYVLALGLWMLAFVGPLGAQHEGHSAAGGGVAEEPLCGLEIPDVPLLDQEGTERRFQSEVLGDRVVVMSFVFTTCTTICPPIGANFSRLQDLLGEDLGEDVALISLTVDPVVDTPERLRAWGERFGRRSGWNLFTGPKTEVHRLLKALQVFTSDKLDHTPTVLVGHAGEDRWVRAYGLSSAQHLADLVRRVRDPEAEAPRCTRDS
jgi:protein SCO1/2